jgi:hypothetical protein
VLGADPLGGAQPFGGVGWRHPDVDDGDLWGGPRDQLQQLVDVAGLPGHLEAGVGQQPGDALAEQRRVVGEHDLHRGRTTTPARPPWVGSLAWPAGHGSHARTSVP